jgi:hypothetical protein
MKYKSSIQYQCGGDPKKLETCNLLVSFDVHAKDERWTGGITVFTWSHANVLHTTAVSSNPDEVTGVCTCRRGHKTLFRAQLDPVVGTVTAAKPRRGVPGLKALAAAMAVVYRCLGLKAKPFKRTHEGEAKDYMLSQDESNEWSRRVREQLRDREDRLGRKVYCQGEVDLDD